MLLADSDIRREAREPALVRTLAQLDEPWLQLPGTEISIPPAAVCTAAWDTIDVRVVGRIGSLEGVTVSSRV